VTWIQVDFFSGFSGGINFVEKDQDFLKETLPSLRAMDKSVNSRDAPDF